ncbi:MAG: PEP-CTERM sorting domain-containing protein, partial [Microcystis panniformis]
YFTDSVNVGVSSSKRKDLFPYFTDSVNVDVSSSKRKEQSPGLIEVGFIDLPVDVEVVYTRLIQVPEPTSILGLFSLGILGAGATIKRQVKRNHSIEKETTKIG